MTDDTRIASARQRLLDLADRCEREGPSDDLNAAIYAAMGFCLHPVTEWSGAQSDTGRTCTSCGADSWGNRNARGQRLHDPVSRYTTSLDAAVTLVPEGWGWMLDGNAKAAGVARDDVCHEGDAQTPALALCAASLRARAAEVE